MKLIPILTYSGESIFPMQTTNFVFTGRIKYIKSLTKPTEVEVEVTISEKMWTTDKTMVNWWLRFWCNGAYRQQTQTYFVDSSLITYDSTEESEIIDCHK